MSVQEHRAEAPDSVRCLVITVSDTRTVETDKSGALIMSLLRDHGYIIADYHIVKDEYIQIKTLLEEAASREDVEAVLLNGGTGIAKRDTTYESIRDLLDKEMPGFNKSTFMSRRCFVIVHKSSSVTKHSSITWFSHRIMTHPPLIPTMVPSVPSKRCIFFPSYKGPPQRESSNIVIFLSLL